MTMPSNVILLPTGPRWRVLIAHRLSAVRHVLRTLVESESIAVVEAADSDDAPRPEAASLIETTLLARAAELAQGKPAAA